MTDARDARILIRVVSYRDPELLRTVASAWENADHPVRVHFAIVNQVGAETANQLEVLHGDSRVVSFQTQWHSARGLGWARRLTDRMHRGEEFTLQVDSHTRFAQGWDTALIEQWSRHDDPLAVLSCYPSAYLNLDDTHAQYTATVPHRIVPAGLDAHGLPKQTGGPAVHGGTQVTLISGGFQFSAGTVCAEVEQVREVMTSDEYVHALRLFTHGWNVYVPDSVPLFHLYRRDKTADMPDFLADFRSTPDQTRTLEKLTARSITTARQIIFGDGAGLLGSHRSRDEFEERTVAGLVPVER